MYKNFKTYEQKNTRFENCSCGQLTAGVCCLWQKPCHILAGVQSYLLISVLVSSLMLERTNCPQWLWNFHGYIHFWWDVAVSNSLVRHLHQSSSSLLGCQCREGNPAGRLHGFNEKGPGWNHQACCSGWKCPAEASANSQISQSDPHSLMLEALLLCKTPHKTHDAS